MKFKFIESFLLEGKNKNVIWDRYKDKLSLVMLKKNFDELDERDSTRLAAIYERLLSIDPTYNSTLPSTGDYGEWLIKYTIAVKGFPHVVDVIETPYNTLFDMENGAYELKEILKYFDKVKPFLKNKDINSYKTPHDIVNAIETITLSEKQFQRLSMKSLSGVKLVFNGENSTVFQPQDAQAERALAKMSGWCTAYDDISVGEQYYNKYTGNNKDKLFVIIPNEQLINGVPVPIHKRSNWLQFAIAHNQYAWGYADGEVDTEIASNSLQQLAGFSEWEEKNQDVMDFIFPKVDIGDVGYKDDIIFLLSVDEYEAYKYKIPELWGTYWLRTKGKYDNTAMYYYSGGTVERVGDSVDKRKLIAPALKYESLDIQRVTKHSFSYKNMLWNIIDEDRKIAMIEDYIDLSVFDEESNDYETSDVRTFLLNWIAR